MPTDDNDNDQKANISAPAPLVQPPPAKPAASQATAPTPQPTPQPVTPAQPQAPVVMSAYLGNAAPINGANGQNASVITDQRGIGAPPASAGYTDSNGVWHNSVQATHNQLTDPNSPDLWGQSFYDAANGKGVIKGQDPYAGTAFAGQDPELMVNKDARDFMYGRNPDYVNQTNAAIRANAAAQQASLEEQGQAGLQQGLAASALGQRYGQQLATAGAQSNTALTNAGLAAQQFGNRAAGSVERQANAINDIGSDLTTHAGQMEYRNGPKADYSQAGASFLGSSGALQQGTGSIGTAASRADLLAGLESQEGPSAAQAQLQAGLNASQAANLAMARSGRGFGGSASAMMQAADQNAAASQQAVNSAAALRAQENAAWRGRQAANLTGAAGINTQGASLFNQQANVLQQQAQTQTQQGLSQAQLTAQQRALNDQTMLGMYNQGLGAMGTAQTGLTNAGQLGLSGNQQNIAALTAGGQQNLAGLQQGSEAAAKGATLGMQGTALGMQGTQTGGQAFAQGESLANSNVAGQQNADLAFENGLIQKYAADQGMALQNDAQKNALIGGLVQGGATAVGAFLGGPGGAVVGNMAGAAANEEIQSDIRAKKDIKPVDERSLVLPAPKAPDTEALDASEYGRQVRPQSPRGAAKWWDADPFAYGRPIDTDAFEPGGLPMRATAQGARELDYESPYQAARGDVAQIDYISDIRAKKDAYPIPAAPDTAALDSSEYGRQVRSDASARAMGAAPAYSYRYRDPDAPGADAGTFYGPMAQDLAKTPVGRTVVQRGADGKLAVDTGRLSLVNSGAISAHQREIDGLKAELDALRAQPDAMSAAPAAYPTPVPVGTTDKSNWGTRYGSGDEKGRGFLGMLKRPDGDESSEISIGVPINGKQTEIPAMVPTLTKRELSQLLALREDQRMPQSIVSKATTHAKQRIAAGMSPFASDAESPDNVSLDEAYAREQQRHMGAM